MKELIERIATLEGHIDALIVAQTRQVRELTEIVNGIDEQLRRVEGRATELSARLRRELPATSRDAARAAGALCSSTSVTRGERKRCEPTGSA